MNTITPATAKIRSFTDLHAWQVGHKLVLMIYETTKYFPDDERFGLTAQLRRAAVSITSNIAEGFRRKTSKDKVSFYTTALGSLTEVANQIRIAKDVGYTDEKTYRDLNQNIESVGRLLKGCMKSAPGFL